MGILAEKDREQLIKIFKPIVNDVRIVMFTQEFECEYCKVTRELLEAVSEISDKISLEVHDFVREAGLAKNYGVDKIPAFALLGDHDYGIRFYGVPTGYEFSSLVEDIIDVSRRDPGLPNEVLTQLSRVNQPVHIQVMISPTCPYCARAVRTAHRFAMANDYITGDMVEVSEFPHLAVKYNVQGVPKIIINEEHSIVGTMPEIELAQAVLKAIGK